MGIPFPNFGPDFDAVNRAHAPEWPGQLALAPEMLLDSS
jgi:hypothetical protein